MPNYEKLLLLRDDGKVEEVSKLSISSRGYGEEAVISYKTVDKFESNLVDAIMGTQAGNATDGARRLKELVDEKAKLQADLEHHKRIGAEEFDHRIKVQDELRQAKDENLSLSANLDHAIAAKAVVAKDLETTREAITLSEDLRMKAVDEANELRSAISGAREHTTALIGERDALLGKLHEREHQLLALKENTMSTDIYADEAETQPMARPETDASPTIWDSIKRDVAAGAKLGGGMAASHLAANGMQKVLKEIGVPVHALQHPVMQVLLQLGAPMALKAVAGVTPGIKDSKVVVQVLATAQTAAVANITKNVVVGAADVVMPLFKEIGAMGKSLGELEGETEAEATVTQETP